MGSLQPTSCAGRSLRSRRSTHAKHEWTRTYPFMASTESALAASMLNCSARKNLSVSLGTPAILYMARHRFMYSLAFTVTYWHKNPEVCTRAGVGGGGQ